jgi:hypothetical protein
MQFDYAGEGDDGYYKAQLPEFFNSIHDPHGEYDSILSEYKESAGMNSSALSMAIDRKGKAMAAFVLSLTA